VNVPPVLCYHKVDPRLELGATRLGPRHFRRQMAALAALGFRGLGAEALLALLGRGTRDEGRGEERGPPSPVPRPSPLVITFDDGYAALAEHAFPVLAELGQPAMVFVVTDYVGRENDWDLRIGRRFRHLDWDTLGAWQERGIEVHSHGATHGRFTWMSDGEVADELGRSREAIRAHLGRDTTVISYPFGAVDARVRRLADAAGYRLGFAGPLGGSDDPLRLPRLPVYPWDRADVPFVMQAGVRGALARWGARTTNRIAILTALTQNLLRHRD
jgi:peptidoglycan/xylan/chitin deacetylase (PgdA/CDA1 family)